MANNLIAARAKSIEKAGMSTRDIGLIRTERALEWVYRWGWTTPHLIDRFFGNANRRCLAARLVKKGLLVETPRSALSGVSIAAPRKLITLSSTGVEEVERTLRDEHDLVNYQQDPIGYLQSPFRRELFAQLTTRFQLDDGHISNYRYDSIMAQKTRPKSNNLPNLVWVKDEMLTGVEIELTARWGRELDLFVLNSLTSLGLIKKNKNQTHSKALSSLIIYTDSRAIGEKLKSSFMPGRKIPIWSQNRNGDYEVHSEATIPDAISGRLLVDVII